MPLAPAMAAAKPRPPPPSYPTARKLKSGISPPLSGGVGGFWRRRRCSMPRAVSSSLVGEREEGRGLAVFSEAETFLLEALLGIQGRGRSANPEQLKEMERAIEVLEDVGGVLEPTNSKLIEGRWQLMFTTRPGTASPIQRTFVGVDFFSVFQEISLRTNDPRVSNIVRFSDTIGELKVEAAATVKDEKRILFKFDRAAFSFKFLPFKVPYPVPFRLLGDEAKGWLDTTYLSDKGNLRISRGNKGTTFVLQKIIEPRQRLLSAISMGTGVTEAIDELVSSRQSNICDEVELLQGEWQLIWASQIEGQSVYETVAIGLRGFQTIEKDGQLQNVVDLIPGCKICAKGKLIRTDRNSYHVTMNYGTVIVGTFAFPVSVRKEFTLKSLYADKKIRISQGHKEIILVHLNIGQEAPDFVGTEARSGS